MAHTLTLARWITALDAPGCPVCRLMREADRDFLVHALREGKARAEMYERIRKAGGFCEGHTRILRRLGSKSLGDRRSLARLSGWLLDDLTSGVAPHGACPACETADEYERMSLAALRDILHPATGDATLRSRFQHGEGLCLNHFVVTASLIEEPEGLRVLAEVQARAWAALSRPLKAYLRKHDYRFSHEPKTPAEERSWVEAVAVIGGTPAGVMDESE